jgi:nucleotide-binding universal stress UspA family protein
MRVLIAVDADASNAEVLAWARRFPGYLREPPQLTLLHVVPIPLEGIAGVQDQTYDLDLEHLEASIHERLADLAGCCELRLRRGHPGREICAEAQGYEMVVIGCRGRSQVSELLLGSTSGYVVHNAPCAVLVLRSSA